MSDEQAAEATASAIRDSARDFLAGSHSLARLRALRGQRPGYERSMWRALARNGWLNLLIAEAEGGLGLGLRELCALSEEVGWHLLPEPFVAAGVQVAVLLRELPGSPLRTQLLGRLLEGELLAGLAWQEQIGELSIARPATRLERAGDRLMLSGHKCCVVPGGDADGHVVLASAADGPVLCWVPGDSRGLRVTDETRADGSLMSGLDLQQVALPASHVLASGDAALRAVEQANDMARVAQSAELLGVARRALALTLDYARTRVQFGKPIGSFQSLQHRLVDAYLQTELIEACIGAVLPLEGRPQSVAPGAASRVKARATHAALLTTRLGIQVHGAMGFTDDCDVGLYFKRALTLGAWLGNAGQHRRRHFAEQRAAVLPPAASPSDVDVQQAPLPPPYPRDTDWDRIPEDEFRRVVRRFFADHFPARLRNAPYRVRWNEIKDWFMTLSRQGWIAPAWPKAFGGMGLPPDKLLAYIEEQERYGVARSPDQGIIMLGPLLIQHGTPAQQREFLPKILAGQNVWCQGYSEPNAGSDLASLRTEAVLDGQHFVVTGQKIWTTLAHDATHIFMLVRTDKNVKAQSGISFLLADLATPGITIRPIRDITGHEEFCEVFFDAVRVPAENLVGELNQGWTIAKALLGFERIYAGSPKQAQYALAQLTTLARARGLFEDPAFAARYAELELDAMDAAAAYTRFADIVKRGEPLPSNVSYLKVWATETYQRIGMLIVEAAEDSGATLGQQHIASAHGEAEIDLLSPLFNATPATIYGGSSEVQRNILARGVLRLPA